MLLKTVMTAALLVGATILAVTPPSPSAMRREGAHQNPDIALSADHIAAARN
jgi:hypothetical protein